MSSARRSGSWNGAITAAIRIRACLVRAAMAAAIASGLGR